jgi:hypothetical protein
MPAAWLAAATAALYVAARVGVTGHMSWTEAILLAVICSVLSLVSYQKDFLSTSSGFALVFSHVRALRGKPCGTGLVDWDWLVR